MPSFDHHGAHIHYEEFGRGFPILTFAPAGLQSVIDGLEPAFCADQSDHRVRGQLSRHRDGSAQRRRPVARADYRAGRLGQLHRRPSRRARPSAHRQMPSLRPVHRRVVYHQHAQGAPERVASAVLAQPIGRVGPMAPGRTAHFNGWAETLKDHPEATQPVLDAFCRNLYAPGFVYCADRDFVKTVRTPCMVLAGNDEAHPWPISEELSKLLPNCEFIPEWKTEPALTPAKARVKEFLSKHTP